MSSGNEMSAGGPRPRDSGNAYPYRSGFIAVVGRPGVGKSTLVNALVGTKTSITSPHPGTTRRSAFGVLEGECQQAVLVDTPGIHRPVTALGREMNRSAQAALDDVDGVLMVVDAAGGIGTGDAHVAREVETKAQGVPVFLACNKIDNQRPQSIMAVLSRAAEWLPIDQGRAEYFPISARTGAGVGDLARAILASLPEGPPYFQPGTRTSRTEEEWIAELVREQLLVVMRDELPHSISCHVSDVEDGVVTCTILVERSSQRQIVIGKGGQVLKRVRERVQPTLPAGTRLALRVEVEPNWQRRPTVLERLGYR